MKFSERLFAIIIGCLILFNVFDAFATILFVNYLEARELNPLLGGILNFSPTAFAVIKIGYVLLVGKVLWDHRHQKPDVLVTTVVITFLYFLLFVYQLVATITALTTRL
jgi:hypothetical protein